MSKSPTLFDEYEISEWAYKYCRDINDDLEIKKNITEPVFAYEYCKHINDDPKIRKNITNSFWAYCYCKKINNDYELRKNITDSDWAYEYCKYIENDPVIRKNITDSFLAYHYCLHINDDPKVRKNITSQYWAWKYCMDIKDDQEIRREHDLTEYISRIIEILCSMNLILLDEKYKGMKYNHNFMCCSCEYEFKDKYTNLRRRKTICNNCGRENPMYSIREK